MTNAQVNVAVTTIAIAVAVIVAITIISVLKSKEWYCRRPHTSSQKIHSHAIQEYTISWYLLGQYVGHSSKNLHFN